METEIELKLFVTPDFLPSIQNTIADFKVLDYCERELINIYYDTPDLWLRQHDIGLRVRQSDGDFVQTLKTAGRVVAGLHQRPEYNAPCQSISPELSLIPQDAWPKGVNLDSVSRQLHPLFSTDFLRKQWLIEMPDGAQIELVFDEGEVRCPHRENDLLCEVELELISGEIDSLFVLARLLAKGGGLRLGNLTKAARGYRLVTDHQGDQISALDMVKLNPQMTTEQAFLQTLEQALSHWLYHEQIYVERAEPKAIVEICYAMGLIRQALTLYAGVVPHTASAALRQELQWLEGELAWINEARAIERLGEDKGHFLRKLSAQKTLCRKLAERYQQLPAPVPVQVTQLLHSARYCALLLNLSHWILTRAWQPFLDDNAQQKLTGLVLDFANRSLAHSWNELVNVLTLDSQLDRVAYLELQPRLFRHLLTDCCLASLYDLDARESFRLPWLDLFQGIDDLLLLEIVRNRLTDDDISEQDKAQIEKWLRRKEESLLHAMDQSCQIGLTLTPYWQS